MLLSFLPKKKLVQLSFLVLIGLILLAIYYVSATKGFYFYFWWFDLLLHFIGGVIITIFIGICFEKDLRAKPALFILAFLVGAAMLIGVFWEFFEWILEHTLFLNSEPPHNPTLEDLLSDLLMDLIGSISAGFWYLRSKKRPTA